MTAGGGDRNIEELKSLVLSTLETNGVLGQIRAQLRASVYKAIESDEDQLSATGSPGHSKLMKSPHARLIAEIVAEFFVFYELKHSLAVFIPEASLGHERRSREDVASDAGLRDVAQDSSILEQLIAAATASKQMDRQQGEQPQPQLQKQQKQQRQPQKEQAPTAPSPAVQRASVESSRSTAAPSPAVERASAESSLQPRVSDGPTLLAETQTADGGNASGVGVRGDSPATTPNGMLPATSETMTQKAKPKVGGLSKTDKGKAAATLATVTTTTPGSSAQEEGSAEAAISGPSEPQVARLGVTHDRRAARSDEFSVADSLGGPATTHDSFDEEFDRKMEEQIDSKIQRVNSCAAGDIAIGPVAIAGSAGPSRPVSPEVVDTAAVADSTGEISLDGSASESGQPQDLRRASSTQTQSSPRSSHHSSTSEDASPVQYASQGSPLASQSVSPSVSNESLRSPAHTSLSSQSQGSLHQPNSEVVRHEAVSRSQESSLHSELDLPLPGGGGGQGASLGSSGSSVANVHNHSRLGLDGAGRGSFAEDSDQEGDGSVTIEDDEEDEGDIDLTDIQSHGSDDQF